MGSVRGAASFSQFPFLFKRKVFFSVFLLSPYIITGNTVTLLKCKTFDVFFCCSLDVSCLLYDYKFVDLKPELCRCTEEMLFI